VGVHSKGGGLPICANGAECADRGRLSRKPLNAFQGADTTIAIIETAIAAIETTFASMPFQSFSEMRHRTA
jgi:hypothetical protein